MCFLRIFAIFLCCIVNIVCVCASDYIDIKLPQGTVSINTTNLEMVMQQDNKPVINLTEPSQIFNAPTKITNNNNQHIITYNDVELIIHSQDSTIFFEIYPTNDRVISWPIFKEDASLKAYLIPEGEGLFIPVNDNVIRSKLQSRFIYADGVQPFVGLMYKDFVLTIIQHTPYRNAMNFNDTGISFDYDHYQRDKQRMYKISMTFSDPELLAPAKVFRTYLKENNNFVSLKEKIKNNNSISKLAGAIHIYVWGNGRTTKALNLLKDIGIENAWIGYAEKPRRNMGQEKWQQTDYVNKEFIELAKTYGYLIAPYDSYHTAQPSHQADCYNTDFGDLLYPKICIKNTDGSIKPGFAGRGCYVSMTALDQDNNQIITDRIAHFKSEGVNSYFLDCHATLEAFDDYSKEHPQTIFDDIQIRLKQLEILSKQGLVIGSETAFADTIPFIAFAHGNFSALYNLHYPYAKQKTIYGGWGPAYKPQIFFKSINVDEDYGVRYAPEYRIPLFQAVFHDSVVVTDRWETPITKFKNLYQDRLLLELLYAVPSMWSLDIDSINKYKLHLKQLKDEFAELHSVLMTLELTDFAYLTEDRKVQQTVFGDKDVTMIANFYDDKSYQTIPPKTLRVIYKNSNIKDITPLKLD